MPCFRESSVRLEQPLVSAFAGVGLGSGVAARKEPGWETIARLLERTRVGGTIVAVDEIVAVDKAVVAATAIVSYSFPPTNS